MKSVSILTYTPAPLGTGESDTLIEVARHFSTLWSSAVATMSTYEWLVADMEGNLLVLRRNEKGVTEDDRRRLEVTSEMLLGEVVNSIVPITAAAADSSSSQTTNPDVGSTTPIIPTAFLATTEGSIYLFATIKPAYQDILMRLQSALAARVKAPGHMPWSKYRAFRNEVREVDEPFRLVDGELVEHFLDLASPGEEGGMAREVVEEINRSVSGTSGTGAAGEGKGMSSVEGIRGMVEGLRRLH